MKRVVFDSNVIVSAFLKPDGVSMKCYKLLFPPNKKIKNFYSKETINDLKSGLRHEKSKITEKDIRKIVKNTKNIHKKQT